jgi:FAD/FMN-containing dehydrogenase
MATMLKIKDATTGAKTKTTKVVKKRVVKKVAKRATKKTAKKSTKRTTKKVLKKVTRKRVKKATTKTPSTKSSGKTLITAQVVNRADLFKQRKPQPLGHLMVEHKLREAGFRGDVSSDPKLLEQYSTDESIFAVRPQIVLQPKRRQDVEIAVQVLGTETKKFHSLSLTPRAAGTGLSGGSLTDSIIIDVSKHLNRLEGVMEGSKGVTITCEPGMMWRDVERELKKHDAYLPSYPASKDICSIGGAIGNNAAGPDSLRYGHCADWVASLEVVLHDGHTYTIQPISYKEYQALSKRDDAYARILKEIFALIEKNEKLIEKAKPKTKKNTAGYALWHCLNGSVAEFKKGKAELDLTRLIAGSQGTIGIITKLTMRAQPIAHDTELIAIPVFNLADAGAVVVEALKYDPINVEVFDGLSFDLAMKNPDFFKARLEGMQYYKVLLAMYTCFHVRWKRQTPEFTLLVTVDGKHAERDAIADAVASIQAAGGTRARHVTSPAEREMFWQVRRASYTLSKFQDPSKRPAAFLEDMTVPPENLAKFFAEVKKLLKEFGVTAAVHGHGGNGHFHFYPLLDFTKQGVGDMVEKMAETFFDTAVKYGGNICGEHNDGIARTPYLNKLFTKKELDLFKAVEHIFDPDDIFNPGKKVNPRFDIKDTLRKTN